ncbi:hypothetical protein BG003_010350 [Podila horticola]|nr:hypothetical protein BG003_010350 [Podila horticola]
MPMPTHPHPSRPSSSGHGLLIHHHAATTPNSPLYEDELPASSKAPLKYALKDIHPDDSKDKVFAAILKALLYLRNKPSSPKELANCIMKNKYTMLGDRDRGRGGGRENASVQSALVRISFFG